MEKTKHLSIENSANLSNETFKEIFYKMWEIRFFDEKVDVSLFDTYRRADSQMYDNKRKINNQYQ